MKCGRPAFLNPGLIPGAVLPGQEEDRPILPDRLTDCLTGREIPFSNRDNIRQKILRYLLEERDYRKGDFAVDREIAFEIEDRPVVSLVDVSIAIDGRTLMILKCASGSLVSRERQILASARLLEKYIVPFVAVTNGLDLEFIDSYSGTVIGCGFASVPCREEMIKNAADLSLKPVNKKKLPHEQRILYTYDAISCPPSCGNTPGR
jgi:hypothetical protein